MTNALPPRLSYGWSKELFLIRGVPGSGKSTMAMDVVGHPDYSNICQHIVEADQFFLINGEYRWDGALRELAHQWCLAETFRKLRRYNRIAVPNTFVQRWEMLKYIEWARQLEVRVFVLEAPGNNLPQVELANRNVHGVTVERIESMLLSWEDITQAEVDVLLNVPESLRSVQPNLKPKLHSIYE